MSMCRTSCRIPEWALGRASGPSLRVSVLALGAVLILCCLLAAGPEQASPRVAVAADLFAELRTFPGEVLVPASGLEPFSTLEPWRVELNRPMPGSKPSSTTAVRGRYLIQYREPGGGSGSAQIGGSTGGNELEQTLVALAERSFTRCPADAPYCAENVGGQDGAAPASEVFRGLTVQDGPAVMEHVVCCGGHYWSLTWFDPARDMTYGLVLVGPTADLYGSEISPDNLDAALAIAELAGQLVPLE